MVDFNLQQFLTEMDRRQCDALRDLSDKVDKGFETVNHTLNAHGERLVLLEASKHAVRWFATTSVGATCAALAEFIVNHWPSHR